MLTSYSASTNSQPQDPTTGNLINFTGTPTATTGNWVNGVYVNSLTCWHPGEPGNCGPYPNVRTNGSINFSYGQINLYQVVNINQALQAAGNNLQVTGFNFGFRAKNGNGWDDARQDYLSAYVKFLKPDSSVALNYDYTQYTNRKYDWTNFLFSETFSNPSLAAGYRAAQVGFVGRDNNGWAGPYGPEIADVSFNLKYRVDPCATDPTSSPTCPGFMAAMNAKTPAPTTSVAAPVVEVVTVVPTVTSSISSTTAKPVADMAKPSTPSRSVAVATALSTIARNQQREQAIQNAAVAMATSEAAAAGDRAQQEAVSVAASLATMSQTLSNASIQTQRQSGAATVNTVSTSQTQAGPPVANTAPANNENKSVAATTVQAPAPRATAPVVASVSYSTTNDTQTVTTPNIQSYFSKTQTATPVQENVTVSTPPRPSNRSVSTTPVTTVVPVTTTNTPVFSQAATEQQSTVSFAYVQSQNTMFAAMAAAPVEQQQQSTAQPVSFARQAEIEQVNNTTSFMTNRTDPLNEVVEAKPIAATNSATESNQTVKANVAENELAGGVDFGRLATTPAGYGNYTSLMLQDGKLYEPKEIYKNQTPVDNARALRQLATDRLHQQMIGQQYRR